MILPFTKPPVLFYQGNETLDKPSEKGELKMKPGSTTIQDLVAQMKRREIRLPEMQRNYVWNAAKVRDLLDSLYRDYPTGTILTWKTDERLPAEDQLPTRKPAIKQDAATHRTYKLLLDGQQRLTSLSAVIYGEPIIVSDRKKPIDIMFNLEHPDMLTPTPEYEEEENDTADATEEEKKQDLQKQLERKTFEIKSKKLEDIPHWVSVTEVLKSKSSSNTVFLKKAGVTGWEHPLYEKYNDRLDALRQIKKYEYSVQDLEAAKSYEEVTDIFVRVNSSGVKLKGSDLAQAQITAKWEGSLIIFEEFQAECKNAGFGFLLGIFIKNLVSFATWQSNPKKVSGLTKEKLETAWGCSKDGFNYAINFLKNNVGIDSPALLSSPSILIAVAHFAHHKNYQLSTKDEAKLRYWVLIANTKGRYSRGSSETLLDQDLREIRNGAGLDAMIELLKTQFTRLDIKEGELKNRNTASAYFKTMFLAFRKDDAKDWRERLVISLNHSGAQHKLQFHHIFPKSLFKEPDTDKQEINDICNFAFIGARTNNKINNELPSVYLPNIDADLLNLQQVPTNADLWEMDKYDKFLAKRRKMVVARLNKFLDHKSIK